ncbi:MBL fold metallo-hydrolase [Sphingomonas sp. SUN039]|uniref:MBL fold metallo-hydrolase n=1 Tax=Sphingomonas sp. SUN039 TaxID=2937787 RepID=UPI0021643734|nr:MBL fold metallo-hydrolase [Sphingomonas sp. SUN039]UVO55207.1 MBL fold metallo-hydrolase [Sphingomonas sp. SUN039]
MRRAIVYVGRGLLWLAVALCLAIVIVPKFLDRIYYQGPVSAHYDGARFFNPDGDDTLAPPGGRSRGNFLIRYLFGTDERPPWPDKVDVTPAKPERRVEGERMVATWVGHATWLIQTNGLNILTDPIWGPTAGPFGFGPRRVAEPGIRFEDLPPIDLVVISHNHYDHMDLGTLKRLWDRDSPLIVTSLGNDALIRSIGAQAVALDWGERRGVVNRCFVPPGYPQVKCEPKLKAEVVVTRNHHWGSRWFADRNRALWSSFTVVLPKGGNLFFAGDTGMGDGQWPREAAKLGPVRLALIPIGAFRFVPGQMGIGSHIGPIDAAEVFDRLGAARGLGMHWGTFRLSYEAYDTPPKLLAEVMKCRGQTGFATSGIGVPVEVAPYAKPIPAKPQGDLASCLKSPAVTALR